MGSIIQCFSQNYLHPAATRRSVASVLHVLPKCPAKKICRTFGRTFGRTCRTFGRTFWKDIGRTFLVHLMACTDDLWIKLKYFAYSLRFSNFFFHFFPFFTIFSILNFNFKIVELIFFCKGFKFLKFLFLRICVKLQHSTCRLRIQLFHF